MTEFSNNLFLDGVNQAIQGGWDMCAEFYTTDKDDEPEFYLQFLGDVISASYPLMDHPQNATKLLIGGPFEKVVELLEWEAGSNTQFIIKAGTRRNKRSHENTDANVIASFIRQYFLEVFGLEETNPIIQLKVEEY
jgi:hypothetical protein